ncbi:coth protein-domain-containing protein [Cokeromyces recurvatus]|uniref:coth protein-domain-containing protein n=1 Tax=Cokeromyces recurvatus TaxID=90255 RepID=UPI00221F40EE|nr:coth protein-domain-containing protein [Cokeromyces recurvatus]KAI7904955.1 coth protein-domain-containing protein [Cokeromyces recurvatus]
MFLLLAFLLLFLLLPGTLQFDLINYNIILSAPSNSSVFVIVDDVTYPLYFDTTSSLVFRGEAPIAKYRYKYGYTDHSNLISVSEHFHRSPLSNVTTTPNHFFNRENDVYNLDHLLQYVSSSLSRPNLHILEQIPTIHLQGDQKAIDTMHNNQLGDGASVKMKISYISLHDTHNFNDVSVTLAGRSSRWVPKLSYKLKLKKNDNLFGYRHLKLRALSHDPSYIRECIAYYILKAAGIVTTGFSYIRVFINNTPIGLFGIIETFQDPWVAVTFGNGSANYISGFMYQGTGFAIDSNNEVFISDLRYEGTNLTKYIIGQYKVKTAPFSRKDLIVYEGLQNFTKFVNESTVLNRTLAEWENLLNVDNFLKAMAVEDLLGLSDGYMTMADNYYLYQDLTTGRYTYIPADLDTSMGICLYNISLMTSGNMTDHPGLTTRPLTKKLLSYKEYMAAYESKLYQFAQDLVNPAVLFPFIDSIVNMIRLDVEWDLSLKRMGNRTLPTSQDGFNTSLILSKMLPGFQMIDWKTISNLSFDQALEGPSSPATNNESVKTFISKKYAAIMKAYKKSSSPPLSAATSILLLS